MSPFPAPALLAFQDAAGKGNAAMPWWLVFGYAVVGSVAVDVVSILAVYKANKEFPPEYRKAGYWFFRVVLVLIGGVLAIALGANTPILAFQIGATAPALIEKFAQAPPPTGP